MKTECIITGVILITPEGHYELRGDMFKQGRTFIVNCNEHSKKEIRTEYPTSVVKWVRPGIYAWERRGVWVFDENDCELSTAAMEYINK